MPLKITFQNAVQLTLHKYSIEASTLGLKPGEWPKSLPTDLGNGRDFILYSADKDGSHYYVQQLGIIRLTVFND